MLHIINGESTAGTLRLSNVQGEKCSFRDALIYGPTPSGVAGAEWAKLRAKHLSDNYGTDLESCERDLLEQQQTLSGFASHEEVVLWFEYDLFCQVNLLYLLHWFSNVSLGNTRLSLINIGAFPGKEDFRGLGELNAEELASLFSDRRQVTNRELEVGAFAWQAYCSDDPTAIERLLKTDTTALPFLSTALRVHLQRFPSLQNGLGRIENKGLELIDGGLHRFGDLFPKFGDAERIYGLGDFQFWLALKPLANAANPLVSASGDETGTKALESEALRNMNVELTQTGRSVLKEKEDFVYLNGVDYWLGGVHLSGRENLWRWDIISERLVLHV